MKKTITNSKKSTRFTIEGIVIAVILLVLLIPLNLVSTLIRERENRFNEAKESIIHDFGGEFKILGPLLVLPYEIPRLTERNGVSVTVPERGEIYVLPDDVSIKGKLDVSYKSRGLYRVPVYQAALEVNGKFKKISGQLFPAGAEPLEAERRFAVGIQDMRGIREISNLSWNSSSSHFQPGPASDVTGSGMAALLPAAYASGSPATFSWTMLSSGGSKIFVTPLGRDSSYEIEGNWASPSFGGAVLPEKSAVSDSSYGSEGQFSAQWRIPEVSRPISPRWDSRLISVDDLAEDLNDQEKPSYLYDIPTNGRGSLNRYALTVELLEPVGVYKKTERSVKYGILFLLFPFAVVFIFGALGRARVHPVQSLLIGIANVVFYVLLLALSEYISFDWSYLIASSAVTLLISLYFTFTGLVGRRGVRAMPITLAASYLWLWVTLRSENFALLIGALGLLVFIALVMYSTRKVEWFGSSSPATENGDSLPDL